LRDWSIVMQIKSGRDTRTDGGDWRYGRQRDQLAGLHLGKLESLVEEWWQIHRNPSINNGLGPRDIVRTKADLVPFS